MADPASAILTLVLFSLQSCKDLHDTVSSFKSNQRTVRELREELEALNEVLGSLQQTIATTDVDFIGLELPLRRCGRACLEFKGVIDKRTEHSSGSRTSFRHWAKLRYMGDDVTGFKNVLASYKSTIIVALGDANMHTSAITANFLKEFKYIIASTTSDLDEHLRAIDAKLHALSRQGLKTSDEDTTERGRIQEERQSAEQCLNICTTVATHIEQIQFANRFENISTPEGAHQSHLNSLKSSSSARLLTAKSLKPCKERMSSSTAWLTTHLQDLDNKLATYYVRPPLHPDTTEQERTREEIESVKQCLAICAESSDRAHEERINVFEDVSMADDGHQVIVSTVGDLISAKRVTAGARSVQLMGQMSDDSLRQFSQSIGCGAAEEEKKPDRGSAFKDRYGEGWRLSRPSS